jgi:ribonuclease G
MRRSARSAESHGVDKVIAIQATLDEVRVAIVEDSTLAEILIEHTTDQGIGGNIYKGRVVRVLPGMQAAFVDVGLEKAAFLHVSDLLTGPDALPATVATNGDTADGAVEFEGRRSTRGKRRPIEQQLKKGNELLVQVAKEPIGTKGARVTSHISLPGRYLVYMPTVAHLGISRRIEDEEERERLREIADALRPPEGGLIIRTACIGISKREMAADVRFLTRLWERIQAQAAEHSVPALIHADMDLVLRTVRDHFTSDVARFVVDTKQDYERVREFVEAVMPRLASRVELHDGTEPLFDKFGIESQIAKALERRAWLKSGGYIVIDQTEALTVIDVNTGRYVGKRTQEETILKTNLQAAEVVVDQLRLRNIGGIIIVDFIDMEDAANRAKLLEALNVAVKKDRSRTNVLTLSELGLVEMTRKRTRNNLQTLLCSPCPYCDGQGRVKAVATVAHELLRQLRREAAEHPGTSHITVSVPPEVATHLCEDAREGLTAIEREYDTRVVIKAVEGLHREQAEVKAAPSDGQGKGAQ